MQKFAIKLILLLSILFFATQNSIADTYPKREMRSAWITPINGNWPLSSERGTSSSFIQKQKDHAIAIIEQMKASGFNAIIIHARPYSDRMYTKTSYTHNGTKYTISEPFSHYVSGTRGTEPTNYDPLAFWVEECHKRGMECHAWINPLRFCNTTKNATKPGWPCNSLSIDTETWNNDWLIYQYQEEDDITKFCFDPSVAGVRERINNVCIIIAGNYDVDGIVWDDYFYPNNIPEDNTAGDYKRYQTYLSNGGTMSMADWRRENCNTMIREAYNSIKSIKPYIKFGLAPAGAGGGNPRNCAFTSEEKNEISVLNGSVNVNVTWSDWQYNTIYADLIAWLREGTIDYISPQLYWSSNHNTNPFNSMCLWWQEVSNYFGRHCYPSNGFSGGYVNSGNGQDDWNEIVSQIETTRNVATSKAPGSIVYPASFFDPYASNYNSGLAANTLYNNVYQKKALVPASTWYKATNPGKPQNVKLSSGILSWTSSSMSEGTVSNIGMRYAIYAIPSNIGINDAKSTIHLTDGGFKSDYLIDVTYSNTFDVSSYSSSDYWYAVTIVDRFGYEWEAATINAPNLDNVSLSLNSPATASVLSFGDNTFSWTSDGTSFTFQISTSEDFTAPLIEQVVTTKNINFSTADLTDGATYYWRVIASKENYNSAWSEIRSFTMETRPTIDITLLTPENTSTINTETIPFSWEGIDGASYTFELAEYSSFNNILISTTTTATSYEIPTTSLTGGKTYFWRIKASRDGYQSSVSDYASFITPKVEGETVDGLTIEKKWIKSVNTGNFPEELNACVSARSMAAYNGNVYILERASSDICSLYEFDGNTGAYIKTISLTGDCYKTSSGNSLSYPCNSIFVDGAGNLCIANMSTSIQSTPLIICTVNISTGYTTRIFESSLNSSSYRIDYSNAFNDVTTTGGQIWAATTTDKVFRWTRNSDGSWIEASTTINGYYPSDATSLGNAPSIQPISSSQFIVDGASTHPTLYTFNSGGNATLDNSFANNATIQPTNTNYNGTYSITIGSTPLFIYVDDNNNGGGHSFSIVANKHNFDFAQFQFMKSVPENKLGTTGHSWNLDQPVAINNADGSVTVFLYAPKNGLAAYRIYLPDMPITLNSPIDNVQTLDGFDFTWSGVDGAKYTIELSTSESFDNIAFSATTEDLMYSSYNFNLAGSTKYYWRIKASHDNYTTTTSAVAQFISPEKPTMTPPKLFVPYNETTHSSDISFVAKKSYLLNGEEKIYASKYILEISRSDDFSDIFYSGDSKWKEKSSEESNYEIWLQYTLPISQFPNGTYYWRVIAQSNNSDYDDGISEVRSFIVVDQYDESTTYKMVRENSSYSEIELGGNNYISLYNNWIRSATYNNGISQASGGIYARGFCVRPDKNGEQNGMDIIYIPNDDISNANLDYYNAATGEFLGTLQMTATDGTTIATSTYPCNGLFVDNAGNLCFYNLAGAGGVLQLCTVDVDLTKKTAVATERFSYTVTNRVDHCRAYGDVASKDFTLFGAASGTNTIYRWSVSGSNVDFKNKSISTNTTDFGYNIMAFPVSENLVYINGNSSNLALYDFDEGKYKNQFTQSNTALCGGGFFIHNNANHFMVYPNTGGSASQHQYKVLSIENIANGNSGSTTRWNIPTDENALPAQSNTTYGTMLIDYLPKLGSTTKSANRNPNTTSVYLYVPGSGLASYSITSHIVTGAENIESNSIKIATTQDEIKFGCEVNNAQIYTLSGMLINSTNNSSSIEKPLNKGVYILQLTINGVTTTHKIVI